MIIPLDIEKKALKKLSGKVLSSEWMDAFAKLTDNERRFNIQNCFNLKLQNKNIINNDLIWQLMYNVHCTMQMCHHQMPKLWLRNIYTTIK